MSGYHPNERIPKYIEEKYNLLSKKESICEIHNPTDVINLKKARQRLKYEELFMYLLKINYLKLEHEKHHEGVQREGNIEDVNKLIKSLPFELTNDQKNALDEVINELNSP